jgi:hypothetical protein
MRKKLFLILCSIGLVFLIFYNVIQNQKKPIALYKPGECIYHIDNNVDNYFKIVDVITVENKNYYVAEVLLFSLVYGLKAHKLMDMEYIDKGHYRYNHAERCALAVRRDLVDKCLKDKHWKFTTLHSKCPATRKEYEKMAESSKADYVKKGKK